MNGALLGAALAAMFWCAWEAFQSAIFKAETKLGALGYVIAGVYWLGVTCWALVVLLGGAGCAP